MSDIIQSYNDLYKYVIDVNIQCKDGNLVVLKVGKVYVDFYLCLPLFFFS